MKFRCWDVHANRLQVGLLACEVGKPGQFMVAMITALSELEGMGVFLALGALKILAYL